METVNSASKRRYLAVGKGNLGWKIGFKIIEDVYYRSEMTLWLLR